MTRPSASAWMAGLVVCVCVLLFGLLFVRSASSSLAGSVENREAEGRLALFRLFEALGFEPELWDKPPGTLPTGAHVVWCAEAPTTFDERVAAGGSGSELDDEDEEPADEDEASLDAEAEPTADEGAWRPLPLELHDLRHYRRFVEDGGTLVLPASAESETFLVRQLELDAFDGLVRAVVRDTDGPTWEVVEPGGEVLRAVAEDAGQLDVDDESDARVRDLLTTSDGRRLAVAVAIGRGDVVLVADDRAFDNGVSPWDGPESDEEHVGLGDQDHAVLAVRLLEELDRGGRLLFDEYALGRWSPTSATGMALSASLALVTFHVLLILGLVVWRSGWPREFPRDPEALSAVSPFTRARAQAALYGRARRWDLLAGFLRRGVLGRLVTRSRAARRFEARALGADATREQTDEAWLEWAAAAVPQVADATGCGRDVARWEAAFLGAPPRSERGLEALGAELAAIELDVEGGLAARRGSRSGIVRTSAEPEPDPGPTARRRVGRRAG